VTAEQRERILQDPLVRQAMELFEGAVINMERVPTAAPSDAAEDTE